MKLIKTLPLLLIAPMLSACKGGTFIIAENMQAFNSVSTMTSKGVSYSFKKCNGYVIFRINLLEDKEPTLQNSVTVEEGTVTITVMNMDDEVLSSKELTESLDFETPLKETGKYKLKLEHVDFKGSYKIKWNQ